MSNVNKKCCKNCDLYTEPCYNNYYKHICLKGYYLEADEDTRIDKIYCDDWTNKYENIECDNFEPYHIGFIKVDQDDIIAIFSDIDDAKEFLMNTPKKYKYRLEIYQLVDIMENE